MARFRLELGPIPLHHQVYLDLSAALDAGEWRPGDRLPPERELAQRYGCSLITVRRALGELAREQRVERTRGRGTFVLRPRIDRDFGGTLSFTEEMQSRGLDPETRLVAARPEPAGEAVAAALGLELGSPTLYLERLRLADGEPLLLEQVHLPAERFPGLLATDLEHNSLYDLLAERYGARVVRAREAIEPVLLRTREARLLDRRRGRRRCSSRAWRSPPDGDPVEFARSYVRGDRTRYYVERVVVRRASATRPARRGRDRGRAGSPARGVSRARRQLIGRPPGDPDALSTSRSGAADTHAYEHAPRVLGADRRRTPSGRRLRTSAATPAAPRRRLRHAAGRAPRSAAGPATPSRSAGSAASVAATREQVEIEEQVAEEFNAAHPDIHLDVRGHGLRGRPRRARRRRSPRATARHRRTGRHRRRRGVPRPVARPRSRSSTTTGYDMSQFPRTPSTSTTSAARARSASRSPSIRRSCGTRPISRRPASTSRRTSTASKYMMPDGIEVEWDYDTVREIAMMLTVDKNGNDATEAGFDPENIVQWGFEPQRDDLRQAGAYWGAGSLVAADGKTVQIPDAWAAAWKWFYDGMWTDHFAMTGPQFQSSDFNPSGYPFFTGNVSMSENYLWTTYGVADAGDDWDMAAIAVDNGTDRAAFNADTFRIMKDTKHPDEAFEVLTYLLDDASTSCSAPTAAMPAREAEQDAFFETLEADFTQTSTGRSRRTASSTPTSRTSSRTMPAYNETLTCSTRTARSGRRRRGSTSTRRSKPPRSRRSRRSGIARLRAWPTDRRPPASRGSTRAR